MCFAIVYILCVTLNECIGKLYWELESIASTAVFEEAEAEAEKEITAAAPTSSNKNIGVATSDARSEQSDYFTAFAGPKPEPHGMIKLIIAEYVCQHCLYYMHFIRLASELCSLAGVLRNVWYLQCPL